MNKKGDPNNVCPLSSDPFTYRWNTDLDYAQAPEYIVAIYLIVTGIVGLTR
jgi:hypothetical protein